MNLPQIRSTSTFAYIGMQTNNAKLDIEQPKADMQITQTPAKMEVQQEDAKVRIDQSEAFADAGMKSITQLNREFAQEGQQAVLEYISKTSQEGDMLGAIENGGNAIADIARQNSIKGRPDFNITFIPKYGSVKIDVDPGRLDINWTLGGADVQTTPNKPIIHYTPGNVETYLRQKNSLNIDFIGGIFDQKG